MKIKNLNINWDKVRNYVGVGIVLVYMGTGTLLFLDKYTNIDKESKYSTYASDDIVYCAPEGYTLETIDGKIYAVCEKNYVIDALKGVNPDGIEYYYLPEGYMLDGLKGYKTVRIIKEPIIVGNYQKKK